MYKAEQFEFFFIHVALQKEYKLSAGKYGNAELVKIPNFLHLTPPHIKTHCQAIKSR